MDIAVIGTSPIILMLALKLSNNNNIKIFDSSKNIGGAWSVKKFNNNLYIPRQTNVVVPTSFREEKKLISLNKYLKTKYHIKIKKFNSFQFKQKYLPKNIFFFDLSFFFQKVKKEIRLKNKQIKKILIKEEKFYLENEKFDKVLLPYFSSINSIANKKKKKLTNYKVSKSKHIVFIMKRKTTKKLIYEEYTDKVFDRYLINGEKNYFVGRVSREYKNKSFKSIIRDTKIKFLDEKNIKKKATFYYKHFKRDEKQIKVLKKNKINNLLIVDTRQFANSLVKLKNIYE